MKELIVFFLMFCVSVAPALPMDASEVVLEEIQDDDQQKSDKDAKREAEIKAKTELLGLGAEIKVKMRSAVSRSHPVTHRGIIEEIFAEGIGLRVGDEIQQIRYSRIEKLNLTKDKYKAKEQVDPARVRQVAAEIGVGEKAKLKLVSNQEIKGRIRSVSVDSFLIADSKTGQTETVLFSEVTEIKKDRMPTWTRVAIIGGVVTAVLVIGGVLVVKSML